MSKTYHSICSRQAQRSLGDTDRILLRPWRETDAEVLYKYASARLTIGLLSHTGAKEMEKCGFVDTGIETGCPNLVVGADKPVKVMKLEK